MCSPALVRPQLLPSGGKKPSDIPVLGLRLHLGGSQSSTVVLQSLVLKV